MRFPIFVVFFALTASCSRSSNYNSVFESVLSAGQTVEATNKNGTIKISYKGPLERRYQWDQQDRTVTLKPRQERFDGKLGIYEPADAWAFGFSKTRLVLDEAVRNFDSEDEAKAALVESSSYMDWVYTPEGLVVGYGQTASRKQVNIDLFQFLIRGQKPANLPTAHSRISVTTVDVGR